VWLPIAPHILLSAQVHLATIRHAQRTDCFALFGFIKITKKIQEKKIVKIFARFSENVVYFCTPHPTSVVGANFCGCIFFDPCSEKIIKKL
jgi:hypothetical protein